jgi:hypothetical protein
MPMRSEYHEERPPRYTINGQLTASQCKSPGDESTDYLKIMASSSAAALHIGCVCMYEIQSLIELIERLCILQRCMTSTWSCCGCKLFVSATVSAKS